MSIAKWIPGRAPLLLTGVTVASLSLLASACCHRPCHSFPRAGYHHHHAGMRGGCDCARGQRRMGRRGKMGHGRHLKKLGAPKLLCAKLLTLHAKLLGLNPDQIAKLKTIRKAAMASHGALRLAKKRIFTALRVEWLKDQPDAAKIQKLVKELTSVMQKGITTMAGYLLQVQAVLTPAQYKKLLSLPPKGRGRRAPCGPAGAPCNHRGKGAGAPDAA